MRGISSPAPRRRSISLAQRSEEHTSELSHDQISYAVFCLKKKKKSRPVTTDNGRANSLRDVIVTRGDVGEERTARILLRLVVVLKFGPPLLLSVEHGAQTRC